MRESRERSLLRSSSFRGGYNKKFGEMIWEKTEVAPLKYDPNDR